MNILEKIENAFLLDEVTEKESMMEHIGDLFEYGNISNNEVIEGVNLLLTHVVLEKGW